MDYLQEVAGIAGINLSIRT